MLKRKVAQEAAVGGAMRALWNESVSLRRSGREAFATLLRRRSFERPLFGALVRAIGEDTRSRSIALLREALADEEAAAAGALAAAFTSADPALDEALAHHARSSRVLVAFTAECARVFRGATSGARLMSLAPRIKEEYRLLLARDVFVPLARRRVVGNAEIGSGLFVLAQAERHLGRWLALAELATASGAPMFRAHAHELATKGPDSSRGAWSLVRWALDSRLDAAAPLPTVRLSSEILARLSDRPSAERDATFLFRVGAVRERAHVHAAALKLAQQRGDDSSKIRALCMLAAEGHGESRAQLCALAEGEGSSDARGLATAALWDAGETDLARDLASSLVVAKELAPVVWGALIRLEATQATPRALLDESRVRWVERGECEA